jgi:8-oxo-dGTP diphosphatase
MLDVTAAIILNDQNQVLICQRGPGGNHGYMWEFPGGKVEEGETLADCLARECLEELEITINVGNLLTSALHRLPTREIRLNFFWATLVTGVPTKKVHNEVRWVNVSELGAYNFCPPDEAAIDLIKSDFKRANDA